MATQKNYFGKGSVRPSLPGVKKPINPADPVAARDLLKDAESSADVDKSPKNDSSINQDTIKSLEKSPAPSLYVGSGSPKNRQSSASKSSKSTKNPLNFNLVRALPLLAILGVIIIAVIFIFGSSSFLGPHISALFTEATNTDYTAYNLRANETFVEILEGKLAMPDSLKTRLEEEGITVVNNQTLKYKDKTITADNFISLYNSDVDFREAVTYARRGRIATFFDDTAKSFYQKLGLSRDVLHSYESTGDSDADSKNYDDLMTKYFDVNSNSTIDTAEQKTSTDAQNNTTTEIISTGAVSSNGSSGSDAKERAKAYLDSVGNKVSSESEGCTTLKIGDMVATAVASNTKYTNAQSFITKMESISKAMAGDGDKSAINSVLNWFTRSATTTVYDPTTGTETSVTGSPLEAESVQTVLSGAPANLSKTKNYSLERAFTSTDSSIERSGFTTETCNNERAGDVVISLSALGVPGESFVRTTIGVLLKTTLGEGVRVVASSVLGLLVPTIAEVMYTNSYTDTVGIAGGEAFGMGAANLNQLAGQQNSAATGASKANVLAYNQANNLTIAQQAEIDRKNYSPFDASNSNTFFGSIASSLLPLATTSSNLWSPITTLSSISSTSLASLNPTYADGEGTTYLTQFGTYCNKVEAIGAVGNIFCNMIAVNDLSVINLPEDDPNYQRVISESIDIVNGQEVVRDGSPLADFITYWMGRYSMPGVYDANIANACKEQISGNIPILSDIVSMVKSIDDDYCKSVADGSRYVYSEDNPYWETEKYHQLWALNVRAKDNLGFYADSENPLTAYREHYDSLHPLDNSRSGYLARISGLTKDDAETVIALFDYYNYIANYRPELAYQFAESKSQPLTFKEFESITNIAHFIKEREYSTAIRREGVVA